ncbi:MAG: ROK family protein [Bacteroidota bacterium]
MKVIEQDKCLLFDIGGTSIRAGVYKRSENQVKKIVKFNTVGVRSNDEMFTESLFDQISRISLDLLDGRHPMGVCIGYPAPIDAEGYALRTPTIWRNKSVKPYPISKRFEEIWPDSKILLVNDVTAAGYALVGQGFKNFCLITVSSGIGNKLFIDGKHFVGPSGFGGELGHVRVDFSDDPLPCDCGDHGHLASIASGRGTLKFVKREARRQQSAFLRSAVAAMCRANVEALTNEMLVEAFSQDDPWVTEMIEKSASYLGRSIAFIHSLTGVDNIFIMGGFSLALGEKYRKILTKSAAQATWNIGQKWDEIIRLVGIQEIGIVGAGHLISKL